VVTKALSIPPAGRQTSSARTDGTLGQDPREVPPNPEPESRLTAAWATVLYTLATLLLHVVGWGLTDIPWDLATSALNCWILQWGRRPLAAIPRGDSRGVPRLIQREPSSPGAADACDSEHLTAQVLQILPVYALTGNIVLSYNLLFLSTSPCCRALGTFLLVRELTGSARARFRGGLSTVRARTDRSVLTHAG